MAEEFFSYRPPLQHHVYVRDARVFLNETNRKYDFIWVDAFARHMIPFHLTTVEFFSELRGHLASGGVLVVNVASSGAGADLLRANAVVQTMRHTFPTIESYAVKGPWKTQSKAENLLFFAGDPVEQRGYADFVGSVSAMVEQQRLPGEASALLSTRRTQPWERGVVLTDDFAPYDLLIGASIREGMPQ
jgi:hypothetical protein